MLEFGRHVVRPGTVQSHRVINPLRFAVEDVGRSLPVVAATTESRKLREHSIAVKVDSASSW